MNGFRQVQPSTSLPYVSSEPYESGFLPASPGWREKPHVCERFPAIAPVARTEQGNNIEGP